MRDLVFDFEKPIVELETKIEEMRQLSQSGEVDISAEISQLEAKAQKLREEVYSSLTRWQRVQLARHPKRCRASAPRYSCRIKRPNSTSTWANCAGPVFLASPVSSPWLS